MQNLETAGQTSEVSKERTAIPGETRPAWSAATKILFRFTFVYLGLYFIGSTEVLLGYGFINVFPGQFGKLDLLCLTETYGDSSPMRLL